MKFHNIMFYIYIPIHTESVLLIVKINNINEIIERKYFIILIIYI